MSTQPSPARFQNRVAIVTRAASGNLLPYLSPDDAAFVTGDNHTIGGGRGCGAQN